MAALTALACLLAATSPADLAQRGLVLLPSSGWSDALLEDLSLGLDALPEKARAFPGGPLEVELHREAAAWGIGDGDSDRLHLYTYRVDDDPRAAAPLSGLTPDERQRLWRRRAVVHAVIRRWDQEQAWSRLSRWRALGGWSDDGTESLLVYAWAFSRRAGSASAALDLATLAEEVLVPAASGDDDPRCLQPSKSRFLDDRLAALDPAWSPPRACPAFEAWARPDHLARVEVVFAVPSGSVGQAMFGHLLLHFVRDDDADASAGEVLQLAALVSPFEPATSYVLNGLTGGFRGVYTLTSFGDVEHESLGLEQRALRRFELKLSEEQRLRLLERAWELQRTGYVDYRFFTANCATMLRFVLEPVLGRSLRPQSPWEAPTQLLEALAGSLTPIEIEPPGGVLARRAWADLGSLIPGAPAGARAALGDAWAKVAGMLADPISAYRALEPPLPEEFESWRADVLLASMRVERHLLDEATVARLRTERGAILPGWVGPTSEELVAARQQRSQQRAADARVALEAELAEWLALDALLREAPRRPLSAKEQSVVDAEHVARDRFTAVAQAVASLPDATLEQARADETRRETADAREGIERAVPESGHGHAGVGLGYTSLGGPLLRVRAAALLEELGDQRLRGFGASNEWQLLHGWVDLVPRPAAPVERAELTVLSVRILGRNGWGWGAGFGYAFAERAHEAALNVEALRLLVANERLTHFLYVSAALRTGVRFEPAAAGLVLPRAGLTARVQLPGSFGNCVRLDAAWRERLRLTTSGATLEHGAVGAARLNVRLGATSGFAFTARADVQLEGWLNGALTAYGAVGVEVD